MKTIVLVRRAATCAAGLVSLYTALGFLAVPAIIKSQAEKLAADKLHRPLSLGEVRFNPYTLTLAVDSLRMKEVQGEATFVSAERIVLDLSWQSLWRRAPVVQQLRIDQPSVRLVRAADGSYSVDDIVALIARQPPSPEPARFSVNNIELKGGRIVFDDKPAASVHTVEGLQLGVPSLSSMPADVDVFVQPLLAAKVNGTPLLLKGKVRPFAEPRDMALELELDDVDLPRYLAYLPSPPSFKLSGARLDARLTASFRQPKQSGPALVIGGALVLKQSTLTDRAGDPVLKLERLDVALGSLDIFAARFDLARVAADGLEATLVRDATGQFNIAQLGGPPAPAAAAGPQAAPSAGVRVSLKELALRNSALDYREPGFQAALAQLNLDLFGLAADTARRSVSLDSVRSDRGSVALRQDPRPPAVRHPAAPDPERPPYKFRIGKLAVKDWSLSVDDRSHGEPSQVTLAPLALTLDKVSTMPGARMALALQAGAGKTGVVGATGALGIAPLFVDLALDLDKVSLLPLQPYATEAVNLRLTQALLSTRGHLQLERAADGELKGGFKGNASVDQLATVDKSTASDFVSWRTLSFSGMDVQLQPLAMSVDKVALSDFFARVIIDPNGRINLQDVRRQAAGERSLTDAGERASAPLAAAAPAAAVAPPLPPIRINILDLSGGRVRFTDNFIRPNYSASLKDLSGSIGGLSSAPDANASVDLKGLVNSAPLAISGRINPLRKDLFLDLKADVRGIELSTLSAYADKYVGYGIDKGKLSFEVAYLLENRQLKSDNRLILDQLTFGDESTNPQANKLPVRLAAALLSDRNGIIDIRVPVAGTLDDPQFSIGGIVLKVVGNAITKAVTAPFTMLASLFGGGEEMSSVEFDPGYALINQDGEARMRTLARALIERPGLKLDITGRVNPATDLEALKRVAIERKVRALKTRDLQAGEGVQPGAAVVVGKEEYPVLLARVFQDEKFDKPRNALGLPKTLTQAEMEALLLANIKLGNDDLLSLARRRSQAAKDWLVATGQVPVERIYIVAARGADGSGDGAPAARAEFSVR